jgi:hypothetical protein
MLLGRDAIHKAALAQAHCSRYCTAGKALLLLTAVGTPGAPLGLGGQAGAVVDVAGHLCAANVVGWAPGFGVATWSEAAGSTGLAAARCAGTCAVDELCSAGGPHCRQKGSSRNSKASQRGHDGREWLSCCCIMRWQCWTCAQAAAILNLVRYIDS